MSNTLSHNMKNSFLRASLPTVLLFLVCIVAMGAQIATSSIDRLTVRQITLVDEKGNAVGLIKGSKGTARIELVSNGGQSGMLLTTDGESSISFRDQGKGRLRLVNADELAVLEMRDEDGKLRVLVGLSKADKPKAMLLDESGENLWGVPESADKKPNPNEREQP